MPKSVLVLISKHSNKPNILFQVGVKTFLKLFQTYSNSKVFFPAFKETPLENLTLNEALQNHGMKLVKVRN